jgi:MFS-type transporter involved in bile tolerance (Atg22 family)
MLQSQPVMNKPEETPKPRGLTDAQIAGLMAQSGCLVLAAIIGAVLAGVWLDRTLQTRPVFTLLLVLGGAPITLFALYRFAIRTVSNARPGGPAASQGTHDHDDE